MLLGGFVALSFGCVEGPGTEGLIQVPTGGDAVATLDDYLPLPAKVSKTVSRNGVAPLSTPRPGSTPLFQGDRVATPAPFATFAPKGPTPTPLMIYPTPSPTPTPTARPSPTPTPTPRPTPTPTPTLPPGYGQAGVPIGNIPDQQRPAPAAP